MLGRTHLLNIYAFLKLTYRMRHIDLPKEIYKHLKAEIFKFIWQNNIQTISQEKVARPKFLGGTAPFDLDVRQKALWLQEAYEMITDTNSEEAR